MTIERSSIIASWRVNAATSGTTPSIIVDHLADNDLTIDWPATGHWDDFPHTNFFFGGIPGSSVRFPSVLHTKGIRLTNIDGNGTIGRALGSECTAFEMTIVIDDIVGTQVGSYIMHIGSESGDGDFAIVAYETGRLEIRFAEESENFSGHRVWYDNYLTAEFQVIHISIDTSRPTDQVKLYDLGIFITPDGEQPYTANATANFERADYNLTFLNRGDGLRPCAGAIVNCQIYNRELGTTAIDPGTIDYSEVDLLSFIAWGGDFRLCSPVPVDGSGTPVITAGDSTVPKQFTDATGVFRDATINPIGNGYAVTQYISADQFTNRARGTGTIIASSATAFESNSNVVKNYTVEKGARAVITGLMLGGFNQRAVRGIGKAVIVGTADLLTNKKAVRDGIGIAVITSNTLIKPTFARKVDAIGIAIITGFGAQTSGSFTRTRVEMSAKIEQISSMEATFNKEAWMHGTISTRVEMEGQRI